MKQLQAIVISTLIACAGPGAAHAQGAAYIGGAPRVSPDGKHILYMSDTSGHMRIHVMRTDGSDVRQLTPDTLTAYSPSWSPDGRQVVFEAPLPGTERIAIMNADGTGFHVISQSKGDQSPSWSPDGRTILFASGTFPNINIFSMNPDGSERTNLSPNPGFDYDPAWSPDGTRIAFVSAERGVGPRIWVMAADGTGRHMLYDDKGLQERPAWSRDGRRIAFQSAVRAVPPARGTTDAYIVVFDLQSGQARRLGSHDSAVYDETPSWFPDGRRIAIQSRRSGAWNVYVIDLEGTVLQQLTR